MKKIIAILITLTMLFSLVSIMPAFAYTAETTTLWTQTFEQNDENDSTATWSNGTNDSTTGYENGARIGPAYDGSVTFDGSDTNAGINGSKCFHFYPSGTTKTNAAAKVYLKQVYEIGKTYILRAEVYVTPNSTNTATTQKVEAAYLYRNKDTNNNVQQSKNAFYVPMNEWTTIETYPFVYTSDMDGLINSAGLNLRIDAKLKCISETDKDRVYVDNVSIVEVSEVKGYFGKANPEETITIDFDDFANAQNEFVKGYDYESNADSVKITNEMDANGNENGKSLKVSPASMTGSRFTFKGIFNEDNLGQSYSIDLKIYPKDATNSKIRVAPKCTDASNNYWYSSGLKDFTVGEDKELKPNVWNDVNIVYTASYYNNDSTKAFVDAFAVSCQPFSSSSDYSHFTYYIDDIVITPINYFTNTDGVKIATEADAGYYADTIDAEEKEGVISVNYYISNEPNIIGRYDNIGVYVYRNDNKDINDNITLDRTTIAAAYNATTGGNGYFNFLIEQIGEEFFDAKVLVKPFVVMRGKMFWGDEYLYCVNDALENGELKWVGPKPVEATE